MKTTVLLLPALLLSTGCATIKTLEATGGSRSDGTVELSYVYGVFEAPQVQWQQGLLTASERCAAWGYSDAEAFGGEKRSCQLPGTYRCLEFFVTVTYQCISAGDSKAQARPEAATTADVPARQAAVPVPARPLPASLPVRYEAPKPQPARVPTTEELWEEQPNRNILAR